MRMRWKGLLLGVILSGTSSLALTNKNSKTARETTENNQKTVISGWVSRLFPGNPQFRTKMPRPTYPDGYTNERLGV